MKPTLQQVIDRLENLAAKRLMIGVADGRNAEIALIHELGTDKIPARPFLVPGIEEFLDQHEDQIAAVGNKVMEGKDAELALGRLGLAVAANVKKYITSADASGSPHGWKPLKPATVAAKGSTKILVDSGELVAAITHKLETI